MMVANWPPGTFAWLAQVFSVASRAGLYAESQAVIDLIGVVAPHYQGRALLEGTLLIHKQRYQEASEKLIEALRGDEQNIFKRYLLYFCLREGGDPDWVQHAEAVAASADEELSQRARLDLGLPGEAGPVMLSAVAASSATSFDRLLVRV
jgi:hypothetical protein